jgi:hypothetical protein
MCVYIYIAYITLQNKVATNMDCSSFKNSGSAIPYICLANFFYTFSRTALGTKCPFVGANAIHVVLFRGTCGRTDNTYQEGLHAR